jgi:DNA repair protein RadC
MKPRDFLNFFKTKSGRLVAFGALFAGGLIIFGVIRKHPSGESTPSEADIKITRDLLRAGQLLKIDVVDHVVMGTFNHTSLRELGYLYPPIHVANPRAESGAAAMLMYRDKVALFKGRNQFARIPPVTVGFDGHTPDSFGQCCHHGFVFNSRSDRCAR